MIINKTKITAILNWCIDKYGKSKYCNSFPTIVLHNSFGYTEDHPSGRYGMCSRKGNRIYIFSKSHKSLLELCGTIIHEYNHYLQSNEEYNEIYHKLIKDGHNIDELYDIHPHEQYCDKIEKQDKKLCKHDLRKILFAND